MRGWSIFFGILIFASIVSVSFSHTVDLYLRVGFLLWEARLATFAVEATFLLSGWSILWYRMQKKDPGKAAYIGFFFGSFMALFSNSAYTVGLDWLFDNKAAQWILALSVVACVGISEAIISQNLLGRKMDERRQEDGNPHPEEVVTKESEKMEVIKEEKKPVENDAEVSTSNDLSIPSTTSIPSTPMETEKNMSPSVSSTTSNKLSSSSANSTSSTLSIPTVKKKLEKVERKEKRHQEVEENRRPAVEREQAKQERNHASTSNAESVAMEIYEQEGRLPGRKRLMEESGVSEWEARKILQELRKKVG